MNLILLEDHECADACVTLTGDRATHLRQVLGVTRGQSVRIGMIDGRYGTGTVEGVDATQVTMQCAFEGEVPPRPRVDVLLALPRPKVMRRLWAQLAALGVGRIMLTNAGRVERDYFDTHILAAATYRALLVEGLQQARDTRLPLVSIHRQFRILVEDHLDELFPSGRRLVADPSSTTSMANAVVDRDQRLLLAIGPEGGWSEFELSLLAAHRFVSVGLGRRTLRVDTACVALLSLAHAALD